MANSLGVIGGEERYSRELYGDVAHDAGRRRSRGLGVVNYYYEEPVAALPSTAAAVAAPPCPGCLAAALAAQQQQQQEEPPEAYNQPWQYDTTAWNADGGADSAIPPVRSHFGVAAMPMPVLVPTPTYDLSLVAGPPPPPPPAIESAPPPPVLRRHIAPPWAAAVASPSVAPDSGYVGVPAAAWRNVRAATPFAESAPVVVETASPRRGGVSLHAVPLGSSAGGFDDD